MYIDVPNGSETSRIVLRDVLYSPNMGVTLVSIGKITDAAMLAVPLYSTAVPVESLTAHAHFSPKSQNSMGSIGRSHRIWKPEVWQGGWQRC